ncbi:hypothetical protein NC652_006041 [Populus alba x Populus x berolinensis]|uniref:Uncharacterized protein n=1 Tax=Populus alba x Populus x berolinensis TaxID=444605 RepID=A0AAD6RDH4_9ROSI|nr:hypothetical protein NC652_006041 [Populus alba x Populus x berolinensis]KAJ7006746.1 hypothetical protein NC653_005950 [Populus alba x Populus x berolinensis]
MGQPCQALNWKHISNCNSSMLEVQSLCTGIATEVLKLLLLGVTGLFEKETGHRATGFIDL